MLSPFKSILSNILRKEINAVASQVPEGLRSLLERSDHQDPLERKQFEITNLNDLRNGALANIYDAQSHSRTEGDQIRNAARSRRLRSTRWLSLMETYDENKRDKVAGAISKFVNKENKRVGRLQTAINSWRSDITSRDQNTKQPFYIKWFKDSPDKEAKDALCQQLENERELWHALSKLDAEAAKQAESLLRGCISTACFVEAVNLTEGAEGADGAERVVSSTVVSSPPIVYVLDFKGDMKASQVANMKEEISALLSLPPHKRPEEIVLRLFSPGGSVYGYGLAERELSRVKAANIKLTACVDEVAASGGYMMAAVADNIVASPWSLLGSIGVISGIPNFAERMGKEGVKFYKLTAGKNKNNLDMFTEPTEEGLKHVKINMERILELFSSHVYKHRHEKLTQSMEKIAQGDVWQGVDALELGLVDTIMTSEEYVNQKMDEGADVYTIKKVSNKEGRSPLEKLFKPNGEMSADDPSSMLMDCGKDLTTVGGQYGGPMLKLEGMHMHTGTMHTYDK